MGVGSLPVSASVLSRREWVSHDCSLSSGERTDDYETCAGLAGAFVETKCLLGAIVGARSMFESSDRLGSSGSSSFGSLCDLDYPESVMGHDIDIAAR
jgi:hypothetical protein